NSRVAISLQIIIRTDNEGRLRVLLAKRLCHWLEVSCGESDSYRIAGCLVNRGACCETLYNTNRLWFCHLADSKIAARDPSAGEESLNTIRPDELQGMKVRAIVNRYHKRTALKPNAMRLNALTF